MPDYQISQNITGAGNYVVGVGDINISYRLDAAAARERQVLDDLLDKVERFWIHSILDPLVKSHSWLDLDEAAESGLVDNPLAQSLDMEQAAGRVYEPTGDRANIGDIYFGVGRTLLILGEPGSGKTIALLKLARVLIEHARNDPKQLEPIPVVLPLGSWKARDRTLRDWVVRQLAELYFVTNGARLIEERRIVLLLDGLDEVADEQQERCARAINVFNQSFGGPGMAVCSRLQDYRNLIAADPESRLRLYGAVSLRPLTDPQIDAYLQGFGAGLSPLRQVLEQDADLRALARTPLMLHVMAVAFEQRGGNQPTMAAPSDQDPDHAWLFDAYIERMLARARKHIRLPETPQMLAWLGWLARQTRLRQQPLFQLERLQPSWLEQPLHRWLYCGLTRILSGLVFGSIIALSDWIAAPEQAASIDPQLWPFGAGAALGAGAGAVMGVIDAVALRPHANDAASRFGRMSRAITLAMLYAPAWGAVALALSLDSGTEVAWGEAIGWGLIAGTFFATRTGIDADTDIHLPERLRWSWPGLGRGLLKGAGAGVAIAATTAFIAHPDDLSHPEVFAIAMLITGGLLGSTTGALFGAFRGENLRQPVAPNQGIRETTKGCLLVCLFTTLTLGLLIGGLTASLYDSAYGVWLGLILGLCVGIAASIWHGGLALIRHYLLRGVLVLGGYTPLGYVGFLNDACDLIFLRRVGGGFQFVHDRLRQHFARRAEVSADGSMTTSGGIA